MPWWGWILVGAILLGSELFVTTEFYLVVLGVAAMSVGLLTAAFDLPVWQQWSAYGVLAVFFLVSFRARVWRWMQRDGGDRPVEGVLGETATISQRIEPGGVGTAELRGSVWKARNVGDTPLLPGQRVRAEQMDGLTLQVRGEPAAPESSGGGI